MPGCPYLLDCAPSDGSRSPSALEDVETSGDENCNDRSGMVAWFASTFFPASLWTDTGFVMHGSDTVTLVGPSSTTRVLSRPITTRTVVAVAAETSGTGCSLSLGVAPDTGSPYSWYSQNIAGADIRFLDFSASYSPPAVLKRIKLECTGTSSTVVDWLQFQDSYVEFAPPSELAVDWQDTRLPAGAHATAVIRDDADDTVYYGDDGGGVARMVGPIWEIANGEGTDSLVMGGVVSVTDLLPLEDGSGELFALTGDMNAAAVGGLWHSFDKGDTWEMLADAVFQEVGEAYAASTHGDDVAGDPRSFNCAGNMMGAGGHLLEAHSTSPAGGDVIYVANADPENMGVSIWDGTELCAMPTTGVSLPADYVGALLRVDAAPNGTPVLMVGYRARVGLGASLYACVLPTGGASCSGAAADCQAVPLGDTSPDVRDLEWDTWLRDIAEDTTQTGVLVVDSGGRPAAIDAECTFAGGSVGEVFLTDDGGYGSVSVAVEEDLLTGDDLLEVAAGEQLTGISLDRDSEYLFVNTPIGEGGRNSRVRAYRVLADDLLSRGPFAVETLSTGDPLVVGYENEDLYHDLRRDQDMNMVGAWLEATVNGRAAPFPARSAPGPMPDFEWIRVDDPWWGDEYEVAAGFNGLHGWFLFGLDEPWTDDTSYEDASYPADVAPEPEGDVGFSFFPTINTANHRTPQGAAVHEAVLAPDGHVWAAQGDLGISHADLSVVAAGWDPNGAEVDCLWEGWRAGANSIVAVPRRESDGNADPVIWATLGDQSSESRAEQGVLRSLNNGTTWEYAGTAFMLTETEPLHSVVKTAPAAWVPGSTKYGFRTCLDLDGAHVAEPFADPAPYPADEYNPAHAFSQGSSLADAQLASTGVLGVTKQIRAVDEDLAVVLLTPADGMPGGLFLTADGGSTWTPLDFDGGAGACDESTFYALAGFELRATPLDDSLPLWDGVDGSLELLVRSRSKAGEACALAQVVVEDVGSAPAATWRWYSLPSVLTQTWGATTCGVAYNNLLAATPASWSSEALLGGQYIRTFSGGLMTQVYGGACLLDLATGSLTRVVDPREAAVTVSAVAPHPTVADTWVFTTSLDPATFGYCAEIRNGPDTWATTWGVACEEPMVGILRGDAGMASVFELGERTPHPTPWTVTWSDINIPDDSADGQGSWLLVGHQRGGAWRGELSW